MKIYYVGLLLFFLVTGLNRSLGQTRKEISVPVLKENKTIDSLLDMILNPHTPHEGIVDSSFKFHWLILWIRLPQDGYCHFGLVTSDGEAINSSVENITKDKWTRSVGYFKYKNLEIFVWSINPLDNLFSKTKRQHIFIISNKSSKKESMNVSDGWKSWDYKYKNGSFSLDPPPVNKD